MSRVYAVRNIASGRAEIGTVEFDIDKASLEWGDRARKEPHASSDPHHPNQAMLVKVAEGSHTIFAAGEGRSEVSVELVAGDYILFTDVKPEKGPSDNLRFCYTGHWSQAGPGGAMLEPAIVQGQVYLQEWRSLD